ASSVSLASRPPRTTAYRRSVSCLHTSRPMPRLPLATTATCSSERPGIVTAGQRSWNPCRISCHQPPTAYAPRFPVLSGFLPAHNERTGSRRAAAGESGPRAARGGRQRPPKKSASDVNHPRGRRVLLARLGESGTPGLISLLSRSLVLGGTVPRTPGCH